MSPRRYSGSSLALVVPLCLPGLLLGAAVLSSPATSARTELALVESDFLRDFKKALDANDAALMQKLVKEKANDAVVTIVEVAESISVEPSEDKEKLHGALREAWKAVHKTEFAEKVYRYFSSINASTKKNLADLKKRYESGLAEFENNQEKKDPQNFDLVEAKLRDLVDYFDQEGDLYHASQCALLCARSMDEVLRNSGVDLALAYKYYAKALELREKLDLKDSAFDECTKRKSTLASRGFDKKKGPDAPAPDPGGAGQPGAPAPTPQAPATPVKVPLAFELVTFDAFQRPTYCADDLYEVWNALALEKKTGNKAAFVQMTGSPVLLRSGSSEIKIDVNGDGQGEEKLPITGNVTPVKLTIGKGDDARPWGFLAMTGIQQDAYQGIQVNLAPVDEQITLYTLGAASVVGNVAGVQLRLIDETFDGIYGSRPQTYGFVGISKDVYQPDFDTLVVGTSKHARPFSELVDLDGKWYRISVAGNGKELVATPAAVETGLVKFTFHGAVPPSTLILQGKSELEKCFFDITDAGAKGMQLPVGSYQLFYGELRKGKKKQMQKCVILPPKSPPVWGVRRGETTTVELGGPFDFDFKLAKDGDKLTVEGKSVRVVGKAGERYERVWNCVPVPEAGFRKKGSKGKAAKYEKMPKVMDNEGITKLGWDAPWSPLDFTFDVKGQGAVEVQLVLKAHDFFGKIESNWKE